MILAVIVRALLLWYLMDVAIWGHRTAAEADYIVQSVFAATFPAHPLWMAIMGVSRAATAAVEL